MRAAALCVPLLQTLWLALVAHEILKTVINMKRTKFNEIWMNNANFIDGTLEIVL
jgi:hypothetical protein